MSKKIEIEVLVLILFAIIAGVVFAFYKSSKKAITARVPLPIVQTPKNPFLNYSESTQISPDGSKKLTMTVITNKDFTKTYTFTASSIDGNNKKVAYALTLGKDTMSIPYNTWSPNNTYIFVLRKSPTGTQAIAASANGSPLTQNQAAFNITDLFNARNTGNAYDQTTGWAADTLLIVNSKTQSGDKGPSYWVEVPGTALIPLATLF